VTEYEAVVKIDENGEEIPIEKLNSNITDKNNNT